MPVNDADLFASIGTAGRQQLVMWSWNTSPADRVCLAFGRRRNDAGE